MHGAEVEDGGIYGYSMGGEIVRVQILSRLRRGGLIPHGWRALDITTGDTVHIRRARELTERYDTPLRGRAMLKGRGYLPETEEEQKGSCP